jgi:hypothetical protein
MQFLNKIMARTALLLAVIAMPQLASAQQIANVDEDGVARLQVIHNAADPGAATVDIYLNGALTLDNFAFRDATGFIELPAGVEHTIVIAPPTSTSVNDGIATFNVTLAANTNYIAVANGVLAPGDFATNPDAQTTAFDLFVIADVRLVDVSDDNVTLNIFHGATDAPAVDIAARAETPIVLVPNAKYGDSATISVPAASYELDIKVAGTQTIAAAFTADLAAAGGAAVTVLASGFYDVSANNFGPQFGLLAVFADGNTAIIPAKTGRAQVIHNAADPGAAIVDVYVNGGLLADDFAFRAASPFLELPAYLPHTIAIAPPTSETVSDAIATFSANLGEDANYHVVANGVLAPADFAANPNDVSTAFDLFILPGARSEAVNSNEVDFRVFHGATDAPAVDVRLTNGGDVLVAGAAYTDASAYLSVPAALYTVDITLPGDPNAVVATYDLDVAAVPGASAFILASGFLTPAANNNGEAFGLLAVLADGTTFLVPASTSIESGFDSQPTSFELQGNYPNPFNPTTNIRYSVPATSEVSLTVYDVLGRQVATLVNGVQATGTYTVNFDATNLSSGVYLYRLQSGNFVQTQKMMLVK